MSYAKRIIPCLDINNGRVVKGVNFVDIRDAGDPIEIAQRYSEQGADEITLLDITATTENRQTFVDLLRQVSQAVSVPIAIGGGIRTLDDVQNMLDAGASKVSINSAAIRDPELIKRASERFGSKHIIVALDAKKVDDHWEIFTHGGQQATGINVVEFAKKMQDYGAGEILLTSMDGDGTKQGYDLGVTRAVADAVSIPVIASGGVGNLQHLADGIIQGGADAVLAASIFHFGEFTIPQAKTFLQQQGIQVNL